MTYLQRSSRPMSDTSLYHALSDVEVARRIRRPYPRVCEWHRPRGATGVLGRVGGPRLVRDPEYLRMGSLRREITQRPLVRTPNRDRYTIGPSSYFGTARSEVCRKPGSVMCAGEGRQPARRITSEFRTKAAAASALLARSDDQEERKGQCSFSTNRSPSALRLAGGPYRQPNKPPNPPAALPRPELTARRGGPDCVIQGVRRGSLGPPDLPAQRDIGAGVGSVARFVPPSDARIVQRYRLAA